MNAAVWRVLGALLVSSWVFALAQSHSLISPGSWGPPVIAAIVMIISGVATAGLGAGSRSLGVLASATGVVWLGVGLGPGLAGEVWPRAFIAGGVVMALPMMLLLVHMATTTQGTAPPARRSVLILSVSAIALMALTVATWNPFYATTASCVVDCRDVPAFIELGPWARTWLRILTAGFGVVVAVWIIVVALRSLRRQTGRTTSGRVLVAIGGLLSGSVALASSLTGLGRAIQPGARWLFVPISSGQLLQTAGAVSVVLVATGVVFVALRSAVLRVRIRRLGTEIEAAPAPGSFAAVLAEALDDPDLEVAYAHRDEAVLVDASGESVLMPATDRLAVTSIERAGRPVAVVRHRPDLVAANITAELRPGLLFALDNERLRAVRLAQLGALRQSRARIVEVSDGERQRIERDLHDGAQQQLLAISIRLRLVREIVAQKGELDLTERLVSAEMDARLASEGLRKVARGIFPGVLARAGLIPALRSLSDEAPVPMEVQGDLPTRPPWTTEAAGYEIAARSLAVAARFGATRVVVTLRHVAAMLMMEISGMKGVPSTDWLDTVEDRVGAAGGVLEVVATPEGGTLLRVELPCG